MITIYDVDIAPRDELDGIVVQVIPDSIANGATTDQLSYVGAADVRYVSDIGTRLDESCGQGWANKGHEPTGVAMVAGHSCILAHPS
jgi:hypothetical protein